MNSRYLQLLDRVLGGDDLNEGEAHMLSRALEDEAVRTGAADWVNFRDLLREKLDTDADARRETSKERLRAKVILNEKRLEHRHAPAARSRVLWQWGAVAAAVMLAVLGAWVFLRPGDNGEYPTASAEGDFTILRDGQPGDVEGLKRGDRIIAGAEGARVHLGGYCDLRLDPGAEIILRGEDGRESVDLETGNMLSKVTPERGEFSVVTLLGRLDVIGTEFTTTVERQLRSKPDTPPAETGSPMQEKAEQPDRRTFGPVIKREIVDWDRPGTECVIDFDSGRMFAIPKRLRQLAGDEAAKETWKWFRANGIDAGADGSATMHGVVGLDVEAAKVKNERWETIAGTDIVRILTESPLRDNEGRALMLRTDRELPATFAFKTREGGMGILQIVGFNENPKSVKIRYRMLPGTLPGVFGIYLVEKPASVREAEKTPLDKLQLAERPILTQDDIESYDWQTHTIWLKPGAPTLVVPPPIKPLAITKGFVVVADGQRCYMGAFSSLTSSYAPGVPSCGVLAAPKSGMKLFGEMRIGRGSTENPDPRVDERIRKALEAAGKLAEHLPALLPDERKRAEALIAQFGDVRFATRQKAVEELVKMKPDVLPLVRKTLAETTDAEVRLRCEMVIRTLGGRPDVAASNKPARPPAPAIVVDVAVHSGVVAFSFGKGKGQLTAGESRRFPAPQAPVVEPQPAVNHVDDGTEEITDPEVVPGVAEANMTANQLFKRALNANNHNEKVRLYTRVIELDPKCAAAWQNRGYSNAILRRLDEALEDYNKCLELDPKNAAAYNNRGQLMLNRGQLPEALNDLNKAVEYQPSMPYPYNHLGRLYVWQGKYDLAIENFNKSIERLGDNDTRWIHIHLNRARAYLHLKEYDKAWADVKYCREKKIRVPADFLNDLERASGKFDGD